MEGEMDPLETGWLRYGPSQQFSGFLAFPRRALKPLPAVLVVHEASGVDAHMEDVTRRIALAGYAAFAPDLFVKGGERPPALAPDRLRDTMTFISELRPDQRMDPSLRDAAIDAAGPSAAASMRETLALLFAGGFLPSLVAAAGFLRVEFPLTRGQKIASMGFCMGGGLSVLLACHEPDLAGALAFYGRPPPADDIVKIRCPVLAFYGKRDTPLLDYVPAFADAMQSAGKQFEAIVYEHAEHAFFNDTRSTYEVAAARDSFARSLAFLRDVLA
jgi:carboxymethylenebutenolidase